MTVTIYIVVAIPLYRGDNCHLKTDPNRPEEIIDVAIPLYRGDNCHPDGKSGYQMF